MSITHTISRAWTINGVTEYPDDITPLAEHHGELHEARDGTPTAIWRSTKRRYRLSWRSPLPAVRDRMVALYAARGTFAVTDNSAATFTAMIPPGGLSTGVAHQPSGLAGTTYTLDVDIYQI